MSAIKKRPVGRPQGSVSANPASKVLPMIRITPKDLVAFKRTAKKSKMKFSEWVRETLKKACKVNTNLLTTTQAASYLILKPQTMAIWRGISIGPSYIKVGRAIRYSKRDLDMWLSKQKVRVS